eukprot:1127253-Prorocentrum_minimum.AAC.4
MVFAHISNPSGAGFAAGTSSAPSCTSNNSLSSFALRTARTYSPHALLSAACLPPAAIISLHTSERPVQVVRVLTAESDKDRVEAGEAGGPMSPS